MGVAYITGFGVQVLGLGGLLLDRFGVWSQSAESAAEFMLNSGGSTSHCAEIPSQSCPGVLMNEELLQGIRSLRSQLELEFVTEEPCCGLTHSLRCWRLEISTLSNIGALSIRIAFRGISYIVHLQGL